MRFCLQRLSMSLALLCAPGPVGGAAGGKDGESSAGAVPGLPGASGGEEDFEAFLEQTVKTIESLSLREKTMRRSVGELMGLDGSASPIELEECAFELLNRFKDALRRSGLYPTLGKEEEDAILGMSPAGFARDCRKRCEEKSRREQEDCEALVEISAKVLGESGIHAFIRHFTDLSRSKEIDELIKRLSKCASARAGGEKASSSVRSSRARPNPDGCRRGE